MMIDSGLGWSEDQMNKVRGVVHDEAMRARVAASFLPLYGPLGADTVTVPANRLDVGPTEGGGPPPQSMKVVDYDTLRLATLAINVSLKNAQVADPELAAAMVMFRRAADTLARVEDAMIFTGQKGPDEGPKGGIDGVPEIFTVSGGGAYAGLTEVNPDATVTVAGGQGDDGQKVFNAIVDAITHLEGTGHLGPFACVLSRDLFRAITTPIPNSMVLPRDSVLPFLDGPLLRTSAMPDGQGVVVSLQGAPVEIVVPSDISVRYLQTTLDARHVFRVSQKFVLRVKEAKGVVAIRKGGGRTRSS